MKTKVSISQKIVNVWTLNNSLLNKSDIAKEVYGVAYIPETKKALDGLIYRNIPHAIALASSNGMNVLTIKGVVKVDPKTKEKVILKGLVKGYKIADETDKPEVLKQLKDKQNRCDAFNQSLINFTELAINNKLLPPSEAKGLAE